MDIRDRRVEALILKTRDYREQDKLLVIVSAENGPEHVIARGAKKTAGSLRSIVQPMSRAELILSPTKGGVSFIKEGVPQESYLDPADDDLARFAYGAYISELALAAWPEQKPASELYYLLLAVYSLLKLDDDYKRTVLFFELSLLRFLGLLPELNVCHNCGQAVQNRRFVLSAPRGALLCEPCADGDPSPRISAGAILTMRRMLDTPLTKLRSIRVSGVIAVELETALDYYLAYHLEYSGRAKQILNELLQ